MGLCYHCGKEQETPLRCPYRNLTFCGDHIAQRYAESMLETGEFKHNPELPGTMGENIKYYTLKDEFGVEDALQLMMYQLVYDDAEYEWGHRDNVLNKDYSRVSVGVASDENRVYLVQGFS